jgi:hypothetical protein
MAKAARHAALRVTVTGPEAPETFGAAHISVSTEKPTPSFVFFAFTKAQLAPVEDTLLTVTGVVEFCEM